jgi:stage III sporulation protein AG
MLSVLFVPTVETNAAPAETKRAIAIVFDNSGSMYLPYNKDESFRENEEKFSSDYILVENNGSETGLKLKTVYPEVKGVAVVCDGADDPVTKEQIISVISALFDISTKNISVVSAE